MLSPGNTLGPYRIEREIGRGGMALVYLASHMRLDRRVALKVLYEHLRGDAQFVQRFLFEARAAARLDHPNIVALFDSGQIDGVDFIAMEYVEGETLADILARVPGPLPFDFTVSVINQVAEALDYAHQRGIVHRDLKPSNILVRPDGHALLTDFGIARAVNLGDLTLTGKILGTPEYMSPEQSEGRPVDGRSDVYSLAIVSYHMLTGRHPFRGATPQATLYAHLHQPLPDPKALSPQLPAATGSVLARGAAKLPDQRYATASEFAQALRASFLPQPVAVPARAPGLWLYITIGFLLGIAALTLVTYFLLRGQPLGG